MDNEGRRKGNEDELRIPKEATSEGGDVDLTGRKSKMSTPLRTYSALYVEEAEIEESYALIGIKGRRTAFSIQQDYPDFHCLMIRGTTGRIGW